MAMKLHGVASSTCTCRVMVCMYEKEVEFQLIPVDLSHGRHKQQPPFLDKNPFGLTPVLEDGDLTLFGSRAITAYIDEKYNDRGVDLTRKNNLREAATVKMWTEVESQQFQPAIAPIIYQHFISPTRGKKPDKSVIKESLQRLEKVVGVYEGRLGQSKYLGGEFYSLADLHHLPCLFYFMQTPFSRLLDGYPRVRSWWETISSRPAFVRVSAGMNFAFFSGESSVE